jgi:hypothetical protein
LSKKPESKEVIDHNLRLAGSGQMVRTGLFVDIESDLVHLQEVTA